MGKSLKIGLIPQSPYVEKCVVSSPNHCSRPGISMELFMFVASLLGYTQFDIKVAKEPRPIINGTLGGLLGMIARGEVDASPTVFAMSQDPIEMSSIDYSLPVTTSITGFVIKEPAVREQRYTAIFEPFSYQLWLLILLATFVIRIFMFSFQLAGIKKRTSLASQTILGITKTIGLVFFLLKAYKSNIFSTLVAQKRSPLPFTSLESYADLFAKREIHMALKPLSSISDIERINIKPFQKIRSALKSNPILNFADELELYRAVAGDSTLSFRSSETTYLHKTSDICNVTFIPATFTWLAFVFPKGSKLKDEFSSVLYSKSHSIDEYNLRLQSRYIKPKRCGTEAKRKIQKQLELKEGMTGCFVFLFSGIGLAFSIFLAEKLAVLIVRR